MELHIKDIENRNLTNDGSLGTFFYKGEKFTGRVYDTYNEKISWIFDVKNGLQDGIEEVYYEGTNILEQISEFKDNAQFGISKEFDEEGKLQSVSVVWNNKYLKTIFLENSKVIKQQDDFDTGKSKYPQEILRLLNLPNKSLIDYSFQNHEK